MRRAAAGLASVLAAAVTATAAAPVAADVAPPVHAGLVYVKNLASIRYQPSVWLAEVDGSGARRLASGSTPKLSPDGRTVAYASNGVRPSYRSSLRVVPAAGGASKVLLSRVNDPYDDLRWSPDSRHLAALAGPELGPFRLVVLDAVTGAQREVARGFFSGVSFSPDGAHLVYSRSPVEDYATRSDLYVAPIDGGPPVRITQDGRSIAPLWGPASIVYTHATPRRHDAPVFNLWRVMPDGSGRAAITHDRVPRLLSGLTPTAFSADGARLLAQFGGQDTSYAVTVDPATGHERVLGRRAENGYLATALSRDGRRILASTGGFDPANRSDVVSLPYAGGRPTVLVRRADLPDWNR